MLISYSSSMASSVAPARERGLKFVLFGLLIKLRSRSRKGAWIEILKPGIGADYFGRRSRKGAWIEIYTSKTRLKMRRVAPARERGLK